MSATALVPGLAQTRASCSAPARHFPWSLDWTTRWSTGKSSPGPPVPALWHYWQPEAEIKIKLSQLQECLGHRLTTRSLKGHWLTSISVDGLQLLCFFFCIAFHSERNSMFKIIWIFNISNENEVTYLFLNHTKRWSRYYKICISIKCIIVSSCLHWSTQMK